MKKLISFDVFDTAIFRTVFKPTDIFDIVESQIKSNFKKLRLEAQDKARKEKLNYTYADIYKHLPQFNKNLELHAELENCYANEEILKIYNSGEYDCIFISDMYLPSTQIAKMLIKCGYENPKVFVSCEMNALKHDGKLFRLVEEKLNKKIYKHYGDNYHADILGAKKNNIPEVVFKPCVEKRVLHIPSLSSSKVFKLLANNEASNKHIAEKIGYYFGVPIYEFTKWVLRNANDTQTVFFNARDGYAPYLIARDIIQTDKNIKYCRMSRRSTHYPTIVLNKPLNAPENLRPYNHLRYHRVDTLREFLDSAKVGDNDYTEIFKELGITEGENMCVKPFVCNQQLFERFILRIQNDIYRVARDEKVNFQKYIDNIGMKNGDIFVDIGYNGTMQNAVEKVTGMHLKGMYFQLLKNNCNVEIPLDKHSFLVNEIVRGYTGIAEIIFSEAEGGVTAYDDNGNPIIYGDSKGRKEIISLITKGVLACAKDMHENNLHATVSECEALLTRFFKHPTIQEAEFGNSNIFENGSLENLESITWFNKDLIMQGGLRECYNRSYWRDAFLLLLRQDDELAYLQDTLIPPNTLQVLTNTKVKQLLEKLVKNDKRFFFYGCSVLATEIIKRYPQLKNNVNFMGFIDQQYAQIKTFEGKRVYSIDEVEQKYADSEIYLSVLYQEMIREQIGKRALKVFNLY